jgi:acetyltransferase-like isoleucine patch superfamily enzyme
MKFKPTPNNLKINFYRWFNRCFFRLKKVHYGLNLQVYNKVYLQIRNGEMYVGDDFTLTSGDCINPLCRNIRACIYITHGGTVNIGNNVGMSSPCLWIKESLTIGNNVKIGGNCLILDTDTHQIDYLARRGHKVADPSKPKTTIQSVPITIEDDVWIGANCIILKGVTIGARSVIGAGSVVTKSIPADCIAAGNPAKVIKFLK